MFLFKAETDYQLLEQTFLILLTRFFPAPWREHRQKQSVFNYPHYLINQPCLQLQVLITKG